MEIILPLISIGVALLISFWLKYRISRSLPLPPGPKGYPILGNVFDFPKLMPWKAFHEWSKIHGDVLLLRIPTKSIIVLGSAQAALDLLEKRSDIYASRPQTIMHELLTPRQWDMVMMENTPRWRAYRREFSQHFNQRIVHNYRHIQLYQCRAFLQRAIDGPTQLSNHIRQIYSAIILKIVYNMEIVDMHDEYIKLSQQAMGSLGMVAIPGKFWVEFLPFLRYIPSWVPGAYFKRFVETYQPIVYKMVDQAFDNVLRTVDAGTAGPSVAATLVEKLRTSTAEKEAKDELEEMARGVTGIAYGGAADTTTAAAQSFFIAISLYPDVQRKAQAELDRVVGHNRLPEFDDYDNLIYIQAILLEAIRWMPVLPIGVPHVVTRDDEYKGFLIPKGATILVNLWSMLRDPNDYPDPERFNPDRYIKDGKLNPTVRDPLTIAFGFGRRICPGRWLGNGSLFITIASVLHTLDIHPILGSNGEKFNPFNHEVEGISLVIEKVPCTVTPRSESAKKLVREWALTAGQEYK